MKMYNFLVLWQQEHEMYQRVSLLTWLSVFVCLSVSSHYWLPHTQKGSHFFVRRIGRTSTNWLSFPFPQTADLFHCQFCFFKQIMGQYLGLNLACRCEYENVQLWKKILTLVPSHDLFWDNKIDLRKRSIAVWFWSFITFWDTNRIRDAKGEELSRDFFYFSIQLKLVNRS